MNATGPRVALGFTIASGLAVLGCDGCRRDHPFTPFAVGSSTVTTRGTPSETPALEQDAAPAAANARDVYPVDGQRLPPDTRQVHVGTRQVDAPTAAVFEAILSADWNTDGAADALTLLRSVAPDAPSAGAVYFHSGLGEDRKLADLPGWLPSRSDCSWHPRIQKVGKNTAAIDLRVSCTATMPNRTATRYLALIEPTRVDPILATWRMADAAPDESLDATLSGADLDNDGKDDATLSVSLTHVPTKREVRAEFTWLDRTAGISREPGHFAASLAPALARLEKQASGRKTATESLERAAVVWRLIASACAESATARVFRADGSAMPCDNLSSSIGRLVSAEVRAALNQGDVLRAAFAVTRAQSALGSPPAAADRANWQKALRKSMTVVEPIAVATSEVRPSLSPSSVHYSPLRFENDGLLLVQTARGIVRVDHHGVQAHEEDASAPPAAWPLSVSANERTLDRILTACDRSELLVVVKTEDGRFLPPAPTPFLAPRPGVCAGGSPIHWRVSPVMFGQEALPVALVEGACIASRGPEACLKPADLGKVVAGSPRSPDGQRLVAQTGVGLISLGGTKPELWEAERIGGAANLTDCVIDNSGEHLACIRAGKPVLISKGSAAQPMR